MNDAFDIYNNSGSDVVCANGTIPASSYLSISAGSSEAWSKDPIVRINILASVLGVQVYGQDLGYGPGSVADSWLQQVAQGIIVY